MTCSICCEKHAIRGLPNTVTFDKALRALGLDPEASWADVIIPFRNPAHTRPRDDVGRGPKGSRTKGQGGSGGLTPLQYCIKPFELHDY